MEQEKTAWQVMVVMQDAMPITNGREEMMPCDCCSAGDHLFERLALE